MTHPRLLEAYVLALIRTYILMSEKMSSSAHCEERFSVSYTKTQQKCRNTGKTIILVTCSTLFLQAKQMSHSTTPVVKKILNVKNGYNFCLVQKPLWLPGQHRCESISSSNYISSTINSNSIYQS